MKTKNIKGKKKNIKHGIAKGAACDRLQELLEELVADPKHVNNITEGLDYLDAKMGADVLLQAMDTVTKMLEGAITNAVSNLQDKDSTNTTMPKYWNWLSERLEDAECGIRKFLHIRKTGAPALTHLISLLPLHTRLPGGPLFPDASLLVTLEEILSKNDDSDPLIDLIADHVESYVDFRESVLRCLQVLLKQSRAQEYAAGVVTLMLRFPVARETPRKKLCVPKDQSEKATYVTRLKSMQKLFSEVWEPLVRLEIPLHSYKKVLLWIPDSVLPHLRDPLCVTDFFMETFDKGGLVSVLALNGIFLLIAIYHLEYPDFYTKVYSLLQPELLHAKYRSRFFHLLNIFLSSSHISEALVAGFVKRLSRLCLYAPPAALQIILPFICNLFIRYPSLEPMLHRTRPVRLENDPFNSEALDPCDSHAQESSLWELETMRRHVCPQISTLAAFIAKPLPKVELDISEHLDITADDIIEKEQKGSMKNVALTFTSPDVLFDTKNDDVWSLWELT